MIKSVFLDKINKQLQQIQHKLHILQENSFIIANSNTIGILAILTTLILTTFGNSSLIAIGAISVVFFAIVTLFTDIGQKIELQNCDGALFVYLIFCTISTINSTMPIESFLGLSKTLIYIAFYFSTLLLLRSKPKFSIICIVIIALIATFEAGIGLLQEHTNVLAGATWQDLSNLTPEQIMTRVFGTLNPQNPNLYGGYMLSALGAITAIFLITLAQKKLKLTIFFGLGFILSIVAIFFSGCRGAYLGLGAFLFCITIFTYKILNTEYKLSQKIKNLWWTTIGGALTLGISCILSNPALSKRILSIFTIRGDSSSSFRMNVYQSSFEMFKDNWIFGIGCGNKVFREIYGLYMLSGFDALSAYCIYLEIALESGIFALLAFLTFIYLLLKDTTKIIKQKCSIVTKIICITIFAELIGIMVHGIVDTVFFRPQIQILFWTNVAILSLFKINHIERVGDIINDN